MTNTTFPRAFVEPEPNEHILSILGRYHILVGRGKLRQTTRKLSKNGGRIYSCTIDSPFYYDLEDFFGFQFDRESQTTMMFYRTFFGDEYFSSSPENPKVIKSEFSHYLPQTRSWRWCEICAKNDIEMYGFTYYKTFHQIPLCQTCIRHDCRLIEKCEHCGIVFSELEVQPMVPTTLQCPRCSGSMTTPCDSLSDDLIALDNMAKQAWARETQFNYQEFRQHIINSCNLPEHMHKNASRADYSRKRDLSDYVINYLSKNQVGSLLTQHVGLREIVDGNAMSIFRALYRPEQLMNPAMTLILGQILIPSKIHEMFSY